MYLTNPLLQRQVRKYLPPALASDPALQPLLRAVAEAYEEAGRNQAFAERTLEVVSTELTEANERLRHESERQLEALNRHHQQTLELQQGMILCFVRRDGDYVHTLCSGQLTARLGWSPGRVVGRKLDDFLAPEQAAALRAAYDAAWAGEECRTSFGSADGAITCLASLRPRLENGVVCEVIVSCVEITELKAAQAEAQKLAMVAARTDNAVVITDARGRIEWVNEGFHRITGYTLPEVLGRTPGSILQGPETDPATIAWMHEQIQRGDSFRTEVVNYTKQGSKYWVAIEVQPIRDDRGEVVRFMAIESDITGRRLADESVRAQFRLSQALAASPGLTEVAEPVLAAIGREMQLDVGFLWLVSPDTTTLTCTATWAPEGGAGKPIVGDSLALNPAATDGRVGRAWREGRIVWEPLGKEESDPRSRAARLRGFQTFLALPIHAGGVVVGVVEFYSHRAESPDEARTLTLRALSAQISQFFDRIQAEESLRRRSEQLVQANAELARASHLKDAFLASMSHELRTPLNSILGLSESIVDGLHGPLTEKQSRYLNLVVTSGRHLLALINDILELAKIEAGQQELQFSSERLAELCQASVQMVAPVAKKRRQQIEMEFPDAGLVLKVDARRIKQILVNLLGNAIKFTPEGGRVGVRFARTGDEVHLAVWDEGIGIADKDLPRLFTPFVQLDTRLSREYSGTGLGLSLVKQLTALHGGRVEVTSQLGKGSTFTVILPASRVVEPEGSTTRPAAARPAELSPASARTPSDGPPHILIAEDQPLNVVAVRDYLEAKGYRISVAENGREVVRLAQELQPDLIMMDVQMPYMDGIEATRILRALPDRKLARVPIIAVTALAMTNDRALCLAAGVNDYLAKPYSLRDLQALIGRLIDKPAAY